MPAGFRLHLVGKTLINVRCCDITLICFVDKLMIIVLYPQNGDRIVTTDYAAVLSGV